MKWNYDGSALATGHYNNEENYINTYILYIYDIILQIKSINTITIIIVILLILMKTIKIAGEDGQLKIWSRSGMLRSVLIQLGKKYKLKSYDFFTS